MESSVKARGRCLQNFACLAQPLIQLLYCTRTRHLQEIYYAVDGDCFQHEVIPGLKAVRGHEDLMRASDTLLMHLLDNTLLNEIPFVFFN